MVTYDTLQSLYVCVWLVNNLISTAQILSPIIFMRYPAVICDQCKSNLSFSLADGRSAGTRDAPLRMFAGETTSPSFSASLLKSVSALIFLDVSPDVAASCCHKVSANGFLRILAFKPLSVLTGVMALTSCRVFAIVSPVPRPPHRLVCPSLSRPSLVLGCLPECRRVRFYITHCHKISQSFHVVTFQPECRLLPRPSHHLVCFKCFDFRMC